MSIQVWYDLYIIKALSIKLIPKFNLGDCPVTPSVEAQSMWFEPAASSAAELEATDICQRPIVFPGLSISQAGSHPWYFFLCSHSRSVFSEFFLPLCPFLSEAPFFLLWSLLPTLSFFSLLWTSSKRSVSLLNLSCPFSLAPRSLFVISPF